jgi:hypothetical protein
VVVQVEDVHAEERDLPAARRNRSRESDPPPHVARPDLEGEGEEPVASTTSWTVIRRSANARAMAAARAVRSFRDVGKPLTTTGSA